MILMTFRLCMIALFILVSCKTSPLQLDAANGTDEGVGETTIEEETKSLTDATPVLETTIYQGDDTGDEDKFTTESLEKCNDSCKPPRPDNKKLATIKPDVLNTTDPLTQAQINLRQDLFNQTTHKIKYYAILVGVKHQIEAPGEKCWDGTNWPETQNWTEERTETYQTTPVRWNPFKDSSTDCVIFVIGENQSCSDYYCNGPLKPDQKYGIKIRAFTDCGYQDTDIIHFETLSYVPVPVISAIVAVVVIFAIVGIILVSLEPDVIKQGKCLPGMKNKSRYSAQPEPLSIKNFQKYSAELLETRGRLSNEFQLLGTISTDEETPCLQGQQFENRKKNRYINILPFDLTRVKLSTIDDDPCSDYINANFIEGYSREVEYIASQGPKEDTSYDFWRMVIEHNVSAIVMLTQLMEQEREKCYKYYPDINETLCFKDLTVKCTSEEELVVGVKRRLLVDNDDVTRTVTQIQVTEWSDFGCPSSTSLLLDLCDLIRKEPRTGPILVHCSAGVGRTGTFIAVDILLQAVRNNNKIDVFGTVLKLRKQRTNMVQSENQYSYIYSCISDAINKVHLRNKLKQ